MTSPHPHESSHYGGLTYDERMSLSEAVGKKVGNLELDLVDARDLLKECRDFIDHRPHHDRPYQPDTPCCRLEQRVDEFLEATYE